MTKKEEEERNIDGTLKRSGSTRHIQKPGERRMKLLEEEEMRSEKERELEEERRAQKIFEKQHPREAAKMRRKSERLARLKKEQALKGNKFEEDEALVLKEDEKEERRYDKSVEEDEEKELAKAKKKDKEDKKSSKKTTKKTSSTKMSLFSNLAQRRAARREAEKKRKAEDLATLPKNPVKRFFARLHPKRVFKFIFSLRGLFFFLKAAAAVFLLAVIAIGGLFLYYKKDLESIRLDQMTVSETVNTYLDRNGNILWEDKGDGDYLLVVEGDDIATYMRQATVAIEDRNFYNHPGVDFTALIRATLSTLTGKGVQGGSTLTQQLIKQVYFADEAKNRTVTGLPRKVKEMILALEVEKMYSKEQIITMYLNESPYGGRRNGVESAAQTYFGKSAKDLTLAESALLAAIPNNPGVLNPYNTYGNEALIARQHKTLDVMAEMGYISKEDAEEAKKVAILDTIKPEASQYDNIKAPHFVLEVKKQLEEKYGVKTMRAGGFTIKTTIDIRAQQYAEQAVANGAALMYANRSDNIALASVDVETAQVLAMVGSSNWNADVYGQVNAATSRLEPGSTIKPVLDYIPLFMQREGQNYGPGSILKDENIDKIYCNGNTAGCRLRNYSGTFYGNIPIRKALAGSLNIPAVKALYINGIDKSLETLHAMGDLSYCDNNDAGGLSIAIGSGCNITPIEHANTYATIARGGVYKPLSYILEVKNSSGDVIESWQDTEGTRAVDEQTAYMVADILGDAAARTMVWGSQGYSFGFVIPNVWTGTKTGTTTTAISTQTKDSLIASFSTSIATVVWNGNHDGSALADSSNTIVRRVVADYMDPVHNQLYASEGKWAPGNKPVRPAGIQTLTVNGITDIWPSWYNKSTSGIEKVDLVFNKRNKKLAAECTPEWLKETVSASKYKDPVSGNEVWSVPDGYNREASDTCSGGDLAGIILNGFAYSNGEVTFDATPGSNPLGSYTITVSYSGGKSPVVLNGEIKNGTNTVKVNDTDNISSLTILISDSKNQTQDSREIQAGSATN